MIQPQHYPGYCRLLATVIDYIVTVIDYIATVIDYEADM